MSKKPEILFLELLDRKDSGFVLNGTEGTSNPVRINYPEMAWIPNEGYILGENDEYVKVRFLENEKSIFFEEQESRKVTFTKRNNKIMFEKGFATISNEGSTKALYTYLDKVFYNKSAPGRPSSATPLFDVIRLNKKAEQINENDFLVAEALILVRKLAKKSEIGYSYDEDKIDAYCKLIGHVGDQDPADKLYILTTMAKAKPREFIEAISQFENSISTVVKQAYDLKIINFEKNVAQFTEGEKIIKNLGGAPMKLKQQIEAVAEFLKTSEGKPFLAELKDAVDANQEKLLANK